MANISGIVKSARKIMRQDVGTGSDELRILQLGWMLFLKIFSDKDKEYLKKHLLLPTYNNFLKTVAQDRNISIEKLKHYADGKIYTATLVKGILVDKISNLITVKENSELRKKNLSLISILLTLLV